MPVRPFRLPCLLGSALALLMTAPPALAQEPPAPAVAAIDPAVARRIARVLKATPLIDGHNDVAYQLAEHHGYRVDRLDEGTDRWPGHPLMTDMARLHRGGVGGQFWSVYVDASLGGDAAIRETVRRIDIIDRMLAAYPNDLARAGTADDIVRLHKAGKVASLLGIEGGHQIGGELAALRSFYRLGARYMTLTHSATTDWADSATDAPRHGGLAPFGVTVIEEMNRLGMLVDLSHVSEETMADVLAIARAPVIFSHSSARALNGHPRNVPDSILARLPANGGVVMINFYTGFVSEAFRQWNAERSAAEARAKTLSVGNPQALEAALAAWDAAHPAPRATIAEVADHIEHVVKVAGHAHVGLGADLDGIEAAPDGLADVAGYPLLLAELVRRGWSDAELAALVGGNVLAAMRRAEATARAMAGEAPRLDRPPVPAAVAAR